MKPISYGKAFALALGAAAVVAAQAHVALPAGGAAAGSTYRAGFVVGHACSGSRSTLALSVRLPAGFTLVDAEPRPGWSLVKSADQVTWTAMSPSDAVPGTAPATFTLVGRLAEAPTTLWFPDAAALRRRFGRVGRRGGCGASEAGVHGAASGTCSRRASPPVRCARRLGPADAAGPDRREACTSA